ncbi:hypothetical protein QJS04_geneDACA001682 [Acorus gramineus]|uniref:Uncharacterized protein n=1 Tax=Acorus gramineus TaxID=55184 RepID=A0AAV9BJM7_ACOGR|nr:hypothetical protein QJS04_geneDACA001682 [Acorus gramineus]
MEGRGTAVKPSRSDEVLEADLQQKLSDQIRSHFDSIAPRRPIKPTRSEPDDPNLSFDVRDIPEFDKFLSLQSQSNQTIIAGTAVDVQEEFVETEYYKRLNSIDKQHHTTGKGFIAVEEVADSPKFQIGEVEGIKVVEKTTVFKSNPATNDWIPSSESAEVAYISSKPNRSESG